MLNLNSKYIIKCFAAFYWKTNNNFHIFVIVMEKALYSLSNIIGKNKTFKFDNY